MGIREPGALTRAIEQLRIDVAESDPDIAIAEAVDDLLMIRTEYLVTIESLKDCGYELIEPEPET